MTNPAIYRLRGRVRQAQGDFRGARDDYRVYLDRRFVTLCGTYTPTTYPLTGIVLSLAPFSIARSAAEHGASGFHFAATTK